MPGRPPAPPVTPAVTAPPDWRPTVDLVDALADLLLGQAARRPAPAAGPGGHLGDGTGRGGTGPR
jgi:hypothetical protein